MSWINNYLPTCDVDRAVGLPKFVLIPSTKSSKLVPWLQQIKVLKIILKI